MPKGFGLEVTNNEIVINNIQGYHQNVLDKVQQYITEGLYNIEASAKANCPVDTGDLRQSIQVQLDSEGMGGKVECAENRNPPIGAYVEFGTGAKVQIPEGLEDYAQQFRTYGPTMKNAAIPAKPFLFPAFFAEQDVILDNIRKVI